MSNDRHARGPRRLGRRHRWEPATPPVRPRRPPRLGTVEDAYLSEVATGRLATLHRPRQWFSGAVYDGDDRLVRSSQRLLGDPRGHRVAADPERVARRTPVDTLDGTWLYGGTWASVFGHFLVETLTTLWPRPEHRPAGLVFHSSFGRHTVAGWHRRLVALAGWPDLPIHVVGQDAPVSVERLVVPGRAASLHAWAHPEARAVWESVAGGFRGAGGPERVYVSRAHLNEQRRAQGHRRPVRTSAAYDRELDSVFADHGFHLFRPETEDVDSQLRTVASCRVIAGLAGSGLHHSAFLPAAGRVLEIGDGRSRDHPVPMQVAIDAASGHERSFVAGGTPAREVDRVLRRLGL
jgi:capsular polysaccharide biosynthesis protein